jgi:hypothetical protein
MPHPTKIFIRHVDATGDGTGSHEMNVDGSTTPVNFLLQPGAGEFYSVHRMLVTVRDGKTGWAPSTFGGLALLTNGVQLAFESSDGVTEYLDLTEGEPIKDNAGWGGLAYDVDVKDYGGGGTDVALLSRLSFDKFGGPITISDSDRFRVTVSDDLTGLVSFHIVLEGRKH